MSLCEERMSSASLAHGWWLKSGCLLLLSLATDTSIVRECCWLLEGKATQQIEQQIKNWSDNWILGNNCAFGVHATKIQIKSPDVLHWGVDGWAWDYMHAWVHTCELKLGWSSSRPFCWTVVICSSIVYKVRRKIIHLIIPFLNSFSSHPSHSLHPDLLAFSDECFVLFSQLQSTLKGVTQHHELAACEVIYVTLHHLLDLCEYGCA